MAPSRRMLLVWVLVLGLVGWLVWVGRDPLPAAAPAAPPGAPGEPVAAAPGRDAAAPAGAGAPAAAGGGDLARRAADGGAAVVTGVVRGPDGAPVPGATVEAARSVVEGLPVLDHGARAARQLAASATTAADGRYALPLPPGRAFVLTARAAGLPPAVRAEVVAGAAIDFDLQHGARLHGVVRRAGAGTPVAGAVVEARASGGLRWTATADAAGAWQLEGLPAGPLQVAIDPPALARPRPADLDLRPGEVRRHDVEVLEGVVVRGRVVAAATGAAVPGATVTEGWRGRQVTTDAEGRFVLPGYAALHSMTLTAGCPGYATAELALRGPGSTAADTRTEVEFRLVRGGAVRGRLVDGAGRAVAGAYVAAAAADHGGPGSAFRSDWCAGRSDAEGRFALAGLHPDLDHHLLAVADGLATLVLALPPPGAGPRDLGAIAMAEACLLMAEVVDEHGAPWIGQPVELHGHPVDRWRLRPGPPPDAAAVAALDSYLAVRHGRTDDRGVVRFGGLATARHELRATQPGSHEVVRLVVPVPAPQPVRLVLRRGAAIGGTVFVSDGGGLPKCYCSIDPLDGQGSSGDVEAGADGGFAAGGLHPGRYRITVYAYPSDADRAAGRSFPVVTTEAVAGAASLRIELAVRRRLSGRVVSAAGEPVAGASVRWVVEGQGDEAVVTDADGGFLLAAPPGVPVLLQVSRDGGPVLAAVPAVAGGPPVVIALGP